MPADQWFYSTDGQSHIGPIAKDEILAIAENCVNQFYREWLLNPLAASWVECWELLH
jgi:hypothetical protein